MKVLNMDVFWKNIRIISLEDCRLMNLNVDMYDNHN